MHRTPAFRSASSSAVRGQGILRALLSLQCKATVLMVVLTATVTAATSGYLVQSSVGVLLEKRDEEITHLTAMLARTAAMRVAECDVAGLHALAKDAANGAPLAYVVFSDLGGNELASHRHRSAWDVDPAGTSTSDKPPISGIPTYHPGSAEGPAFLDLLYPISTRADGGEATPDSASRLVGYVRSGVMANAWHQVLVSKVDLLIGVGMIAIVIAVPLGFLVIRRIVSPLGVLEEAIVRFSHGDLTVRSPVGRGDEIGRLAQAFNGMADQHQQTHERMARMNTDLEARVAKRTQQLRELAAREPLTGLYNRRHFNEMLERCFAEAVRYQHDLSCIMLDLDNFKAVNDTSGHHVGDELLILAAAIITSQLRSSDIPARYGGDEFIMLLPQTGSERAEVLGERIVERFAAEAAERLGHLRTGMSVGIASLQSINATSADDLIRAADRSLYQAKAAGKNRIIVAAANPTHAPL